jgi:hypothetical protein
MCDALDPFVFIEPATTSQYRVYSVPIDRPQRRYAKGNMVWSLRFFYADRRLAEMMTAYEFVDDVTISEVVSQSISHMQLAAQQLAEWSKKNLMNINTKKTKEMMLGLALLDPPSLTVVNDRTIERVASFKLLGVIIANNFNWDEHITTICNKAKKRLQYLKLLKRCLVSAEDLLHYYKSVIRPTIEYACPVWQSAWPYQ